MPSSVATYCVECGALAGPDARYCQACGRRLYTPRTADAPRPLIETQPILDAQAVEVEEPAPEASAAPAVIESDGRGAPVAAPHGAHALAAVPRFAALAWQQPVVRSAVATSASAVALSVAWRLAVSAIATRRTAAAGDLAGSLAPVMSELARDATYKRIGRRSRRRGRIIEEVVYIRRTVTR